MTHKLHKLMTNKLHKASKHKVRSFIGFTYLRN